MFKYGWVIRLWPLFPKIIRLPFFLFFLFWCVICCTSISVKSNLERIPDQPCVQFIIVIINNVGGHFKVEHRLWCLNVCNIYILHFVSDKKKLLWTPHSQNRVFVLKVNKHNSSSSGLINKHNIFPPCVLRVFVFPTLPQHPTKLSICHIWASNPDLDPNVGSAPPSLHQHRQLLKPRQCTQTQLLSSL